MPSIRLLPQLTLPRPWHQVLAAMAMLLFLSWMSIKTGALLGFASLFLIPIAWGGLLLPMGWSLVIGVMASAAWVVSALELQLPQRIGQTDWLTLPLIYPSIAFLLSHLSTTRRKLEQVLERERNAARIDVLTGLLNRRGFFEKIDSLSHDRNQCGDITLAFLDLDQFKSLNDGMGHDVGDSLLVTIGGTIRREEHQGMIASRIGGDEFVLMFPCSEPASVKQRLVSLRKSLNGVCAQFSDKVTVSMGAAHFQKTLPQPDMALKIVDGLMYSAKNSGKNKICFVILEPKDWPEIMNRPHLGEIKGRIQSVAEDLA